MDKDELAKWLKSNGCIRCLHVVPGKPEESHVVWRIRPDVLEQLLAQQSFIAWQDGYDEGKKVAYETGVDKRCRM